MPHKISFIRTLPDGVKTDLTDAGQTVFQNYLDSGKITSTSVTDNIDGSETVELIFDSSGSATNYLADMTSINEEQNDSYRSVLTKMDI
tara:strand:- start:100 stop:366 length:267 start_codon:yes stop_codon:yes gene_type:complete